MNASENTLAAFVLSRLLFFHPHCCTKVGNAGFHPHGADFTYSEVTL